MTKMIIGWVCLGTGMSLAALSWFLASPTRKHQTRPIDVVALDELYERLPNGKETT